MISLVAVGVADVVVDDAAGCQC